MCCYVCMNNNHVILSHNVKRNNELNKTDNWIELQTTTKLSLTFIVTDCVWCWQVCFNFSVCCCCTKCKSTKNPIKSISLSESTSWNEHHFLLLFLPDFCFCCLGCVVCCLPTKIKPKKIAELLLLLLLLYQQQVLNLFFIIINFKGCPIRLFIYIEFVVSVYTQTSIKQEKRKNLKVFNPDSHIHTNQILIHFSLQTKQHGILYTLLAYYILFNIKIHTTHTN